MEHLRLEKVREVLSQIKRPLLPDLQTKEKNNDQLETLSKAVVTKTAQ